MGDISKLYRDYKEFSKVWNVEDTNHKVLKACLRIDDDIIWGEYDLSYRRDCNILLIRNRFDSFVCRIDHGLEINGKVMDPIKNYTGFMQTLALLGTAVGADYVTAVNGHSGAVDIFTDVKAAHASGVAIGPANWKGELYLDQQSWYQTTAYDLNNQKIEKLTSYHPFASLSMANPHGILYSTESDKVASGSSVYSTHLYNMGLEFLNDGNAAISKHKGRILLDVPRYYNSVTDGGEISLKSVWERTSAVDRDHLLNFVVNGDGLIYKRTSTSIGEDDIDFTRTNGVITLRHKDEKGDKIVAFDADYSGIQILYRKAPDAVTSMDMDAVGVAWKVSLPADQSEYTSNFTVQHYSFWFEKKNPKDTTKAGSFWFTEQNQVELVDGSGNPPYAKILTSKVLTEKKLLTDKENAPVILRAEHFNDDHFIIDETKKLISIKDKTKEINWGEWPGATKPDQFKYAAPSGAKPKGEWSLDETYLQGRVVTYTKIGIQDFTDQDHDIEIKQDSVLKTDKFYITDKFIEKFSETQLGLVKSMMNPNDFLVKKIDPPHSPYYNISIKDDRWIQTYMMGFDMDQQNNRNFDKKYSFYHTGKPSGGASVGIAFNKSHIREMFDVNHNGIHDKMSTSNFYDMGKEDESTKFFFDYHAHAKHFDVDMNRDTFGNKSINYCFWYDPSYEKMYVSEGWVKNMVSLNINNIFSFNSADFVVTENTDPDKPLRTVRLKIDQQLTLENVFNKVFKGATLFDSDFTTHFSDSEPKVPYLRPELDRLFRNKDKLIKVFGQEFELVQVTQSDVKLNYWRVQLGKGMVPFDRFLVNNQIGEVFDPSYFSIAYNQTTKKYLITLTQTTLGISWEALNTTLKSHFSVDDFVFIPAHDNVPEILKIKKIGWNQAREMLFKELDPNVFEVKNVDDTNVPHIKLKEQAIKFKKEDLFPMVKAIFVDVTTSVKWSWEESNKTGTIASLAWQIVQPAVQEGIVKSGQKFLESSIASGIVITLPNVDPVAGIGDNDYGYKLLNNALRFTDPTAQVSQTVPVVGKYFVREMVNKGTVQAPQWIAQTSLNTACTDNPSLGWISDEYFTMSNGLLTISSNITKPGWTYIATMLRGKSTDGTGKEWPHLSDEFAIRAVYTPLNPKDPTVYQLQIGKLQWGNMRESFLTYPNLNELYRVSVGTAAMNPDIFNVALNAKANPSDPDIFGLTLRLDNRCIKVFKTRYDTNIPCDPFIGIYAYASDVDTQGAKPREPYQSIIADDNGLRVKQQGNTYACFNEIFQSTTTIKKVIAVTQDNYNKVGFELKYAPQSFEFNQNNEFDIKIDQSQSILYKTSSSSGLGMQFDPGCLSDGGQGTGLTIKYDTATLDVNSNGLTVRNVTQVGFTADDPLVLYTAADTTKHLKFLIDPNGGIMNTPSVGIKVDFGQVWQNVPLQAPLVKINDATAGNPPHWVLTLGIAADGGIRGNAGSGSEIGIKVTPNKGLALTTNGLEAALGADLQFEGGAIAVKTGGAIYRDVLDNNKLKVKTDPRHFDQTDPSKLSLIIENVGQDIGSYNSYQLHQADNQISIYRDEACPKIYSGDGSPDHPFRWRTYCVAYYSFVDATLTSWMSFVSFFNLKTVLMAAFPEGGAYDERQWPFDVAGPGVPDERVLDERQIWTGLRIIDWWVDGSGANGHQTTLYPDVNPYAEARAQMPITPYIHRATSSTPIPAPTIRLGLGPQPASILATLPITCTGYLRIGYYGRVS